MIYPKSIFMAMFSPGTNATAEPSPAMAKMVDKNRVRIK